MQDVVVWDELLHYPNSDAERVLMRRQILPDSDSHSHPHLDSASDSEAITRLWMNDR